MNKTIFGIVNEKHTAAVKEMLLQKGYNVEHCEVTSEQVGKIKDKPVIGFRLNTAIKKGRFSFPQLIKKTFVTVEDMTGFVNNLE